MSSNYILLSNGGFVSVDELYHHGVKGMKWGVRRYQNPDGTLTAAGKKRAAKRRSDDIVIEKGTQLRAEKKASKLEYKAAKKIAKGNRLSKTQGYGAKAMKYSIKSDKVAIKAAKVRKKIANNNAYSAMMNKRLESLDPDKLNKIKNSMSEYFAEEPKA